MHSQRVLQVLKNMEEEGLSQILVSSRSSIFYLTGLWIEPGERMLALLLKDDGTLSVFGNALFSADIKTVDIPHFFHKDSEDPVSDIARAMKPGKIGIDKFWPAKFLLPLLEKRPDLRAVQGSSPIDRTRMIKDDSEIKVMRKLSHKNDIVMSEVIKKIEENCTETDLADLLSETYKLLGADNPAIPQIVSFGANAADPHHSPESIFLEKRCCVLFDIFMSFSHYWCDMTRTVYFKNITKKEQEIYETVKLANEEAIKCVKPGVSLSEIDRTARDVISDAGYGKYFTHRLGHGIGVDCHESPDVSTSSNQIALPGMIFSIEPGIYVPEKTGVRIEDLVLVTEDGCEVLNHYSKDLQIIEKAFH